MPCGGQAVFNHGMDWSHLLLGTWSWYRPLLSLLAIYLLLAAYAVFFAESVIFQPPRPSYDEDLRGLVFFETSAGERIAAIHLEAAPGMPTILYAHGNAEDIGHSRWLYEAWHAAGLGVLAYDYPGYGLSDGSPGEQAANRAALAAWEHLIGQGVPPRSVVVAGRSVGSGPSCWLAARVDAGALVLVSPLTSAYAVMIPTWLFPRDRFRNLRLMPEIRAPLLVVHGEKDGVIPVSHGRRLHEASAAETRVWLPVPDAGHNDLFDVAPDLPETIAAFAIRATTGN